MSTKHRYWNRTHELNKLIEVLKNSGIYGVEELTKLLAQTIQGYARQLSIEPLTKYELEYVWIKLLD